MNFLIYSLQAGIGLLLMYAFYRVFLVRLTFYKANRFYLAGYGALCLLVPFVNTSGLWPKEVEQYTAYTQVTTTAGVPTMTGPALVQKAAASPTDIQHILLYLLLVGTAVMLLRLTVQIASLVRVRKTAVLLPEAPEEGIRLFAMPYPLAPFSFGHSIFVHPSAQQSPEFDRILDHEVAHIRQGHSLDILFSQVLLVLQWWNPIAWLLDRSIRQNLEFLADQAVLDKGVDARQYQYLLLKVSGLSVPALSNSFNFSPLKNRIAMMNKQRSATRQVSRFLFALPLLVLLLVAASRHRPIRALGFDTFHLVGFIVDGATLKPVPDARIKEKISGLSTTSDEQGFFTLDIPVAGRTDTLNVNVKVEKGDNTGWTGFAAPLATSDGKPREWDGSLDFIGIASKKSATRGFSNSTSLTPEEDAALRTNQSSEREKAYTKFLLAAQSNQRAEAAFAASPKQIYFLIDGNAYVSIGNGYMSEDGPINVILIDGKRMTGAEVNKAYTRQQLSGDGEALDAKTAKKLYGIDEDLFVLHTKAQP